MNVIKNLIKKASDLASKMKFCMLTTFSFFDCTFHRKWQFYTKALHVILNFVLQCQKITYFSIKIVEKFPSYQMLLTKVLHSVSHGVRLKD